MTASGGTLLLLGFGNYEVQGVHLMKSNPLV